MFYITPNSNEAFILGSLCYIYPKFNDLKNLNGQVHKRSFNIFTIVYRVLLFQMTAAPPPQSSTHQHFIIEYEGICCCYINILLNREKEIP